jgi:hypothetical protein
MVSFLEMLFARLHFHLSGADITDNCIRRVLFITAKDKPAKHVLFGSNPF